MVFDLDACCWYPEMYMLHRGAPFSQTTDPDVLKTCKGERLALVTGDGRASRGLFAWREEGEAAGQRAEHLEGLALAALGRVHAIASVFQAAT